MKAHPRVQLAAAVLGLASACAPHSEQAPVRAASTAEPARDTRATHATELRRYLDRATTVRIEHDGSEPRTVGDREALASLWRVLGLERTVDSRDRGVMCRPGLPQLRFYDSTETELGTITFCQNVGLGSGWFRGGGDPGGKIDVADPPALERWLRDNGAH